MRTYTETMQHFFKLSGLTQADLARRCHMPAAQVSMYLTGRRRIPRFDYACTIAEALGVTIQDFSDYMYEGEPSVILYHHKRDDSDSTSGN
jgi:transcriptional regulator with XRE-family HTH domain